eukprot:gnl/Chilomastix_cuspidata/5025.p1 GENE.gnl/Chilomastix_cuspidata/5025~~gnl/Chilomastix_cuspidata/5025.p1  ORF type:complete len:739 (+),score=239.87 gnl/Chilomastix_cuspidata/5025:107-2218(+)
MTLSLYDFKAGLNTLWYWGSSIAEENIEKTKKTTWKLVMPHIKSQLVSQTSNFIVSPIVNDPHSPAMLFYSLFQIAPPSTDSAKRLYHLYKTPDAAATHFVPQLLEKHRAGALLEFESDNSRYMFAKEPVLFAFGFEVDRTQIAPLRLPGAIRTLQTFLQLAGDFLLKAFARRLTFVCNSFHEFDSFFRPNLQSLLALLTRAPASPRSPARSYAHAPEDGVGDSGPLATVRQFLSSVERGGRVRHSTVDMPRFPADSPSPRASPGICVMPYAYGSSSTADSALDSSTLWQPSPEHGGAARENTQQFLSLFALSHFIRPRFETRGVASAVTAFVQSGFRAVVIGTSEWDISRMIATLATFLPSTETHSVLPVVLAADRRQFEAPTDFMSSSCAASTPDPRASGAADSDPERTMPSSGTKKPRGIRAMLSRFPIPSGFRLVGICCGEEFSTKLFWNIVFWSPEPLALISVGGPAPRAESQMSVSQLFSDASSATSATDPSGSERRPKAHAQLTVKANMVCDIGRWYTLRQELLTFDNMPHVAGTAFDAAASKKFRENRLGSMFSAVEPAEPVLRAIRRAEMVPSTLMRYRFLRAWLACVTQRALALVCFVKTSVPLSHFALAPVCSGAAHRPPAPPAASPLASAERPLSDPSFSSVFPVATQIYRPLDRETKARIVAAFETERGAFRTLLAVANYLTPGFFNIFS